MRNGLVSDFGRVFRSSSFGHLQEKTATDNAYWLTYGSWTIVAMVAFASLAANSTGQRLSQPKTSCLGSIARKPAGRGS